MQKLSELLWKKDGFDAKLRCENYFDDEEYAAIKRALVENGAEWKKSGCVPLEDTVALAGFVDTLAGYVDFNEEAAIKAEDACAEVQRLLAELLY